MAADDEIKFEIAGSVDAAIAKKMWTQKVSDEMEQEEILAANWNGGAESKV
jgi:hypothetical protein